MWHTLWVEELKEGRLKGLALNLNNESLDLQHSFARMVIKGLGVQIIRWMCYGPSGQCRATAAIATAIVKRVQGGFTARGT